MTHPEIARRRMHNQQLLAASITDPVEMVRWFGAVQSQDYYGAKWAIGLRAGVTDETVHQAVNQGAILRLHVLRPTWHFVTAEDARWLLALTGARVVRGNASRYRALMLDEAVFARSQEVFRQELAGGHHKTRAELELALTQAGIPNNYPQRQAHLLMHAELTGLLCSGAWQGKQATYALLEERAPASALLEREPALAELARRYMTSHGPATLKDLAWWSGLTLSDARMGVDLAGPALQREEIDGQTYWSPAEGITLGESSAGSSAGSGPIVHLLPNFDEYVVAYTDRSAIFDPAHNHQLHMRGGVLNPVILVDGLVVGGWNRVIKRSGVQVNASPLWPLSNEVQAALEQAARRYGDFLGLPATLNLAPAS